ncbi:discoidin domain-containing protein [Odoribacter splanchnicus]|uniref:discoidin domain-containing protein n=1 Tax=Odoribacter splanchnicus TaxID=28118 RepID=UPI0032C0827E
MTVDMQETKRVNGFAIEQVASDIATSPRKRAFMARKVQVQFSVDGSVWTEAIDYTLGTTLGEIDLLSIAAPTNARYLKFVLTDQNYRNVYSISLQKIRIF